MTRIGSIRRASAELNDDDGDVWFLDVDQTTAALIRGQMRPLCR